MHLSRMLLLTGILLGLYGLAFGSDVPSNMSVQGMLAASGGGPVAAGNYTLAFRIFNA